jgi:hypothetical protein
MNNRLVAVMAFVVAGCAATGTASPYDDLDTLIPRVEMSEAIFKTLSAALDSYQPGKDFTPDLRRRNAAALARMRRAPWPDLKRLEFTRFCSSEGAEHDRTAWYLPSRKWSGYLILPASFETLALRESEYPKLAAVKYIDGLTALVGDLENPSGLGRIALQYSRPPRRKGSQMENPSGLGRIVLGCDDTGTRATTELLLFHHAYAAAYFGRQEEARTLLHEALRQKATCIADAYEEWAWRSFLRGICLLADDATYQEVVTQWKETQRVYGESSYGAQLKELLGELEKQAAEDYELAEAATPTPERLRLERRIPYYLARLPEMHKNADNTGGWWYDFEMFATRQAPLLSDRLVSIGRPAVPGLIEHLTDRRVTRLVHSRDCFEHRAIPLRGQDVALACIERILKMSFYQPPVDGKEQIYDGNGKVTLRPIMAYFSMEPEANRQKVIGEITKWWATYGEKPVAEGLLARLEQVPVSERMGMLREIEASGKKPVPGAAAILKRWVAADAPERLWIYADELARRGDRSLLPALRERLGEAQGDDFGKCAAVLLAYGDAADYRWLRQASRKDMAQGRKLHDSRLWGFVYEQVHDSTNPLAVPILVDLLDAREIINVQWMKGPNGTKGLSPAEVCLETLVRLTGHGEGAHSGKSVEDRFARADRWIAWWQKEGKVAYCKAHSQVKQVLDDRAAE